MEQPTCCGACIRCSSRGSSEIASQTQRLHGALTNGNSLPLLMRQNDSCPLSWCSRSDFFHFLTRVCEKQQADAGSWRICSEIWLDRSSGMPHTQPMLSLGPDPISQFRASYKSSRHRWSPPPPAARMRALHLNHCIFSRAACRSRSAHLDH